MWGKHGGAHGKQQRCRRGQILQSPVAQKFGWKRTGPGPGLGGAGWAGLGRTGQVGVGGEGGQQLLHQFDRLLKSPHAVWVQERLLEQRPRLPTRPRSLNWLGAGTRPRSLGERGVRARVGVGEWAWACVRARARIRRSGGLLIVCVRERVRDQAASSSCVCVREKSGGLLIVFERLGGLWR